MPRVVLELSDDVLDRLDRLAQERMTSDRPLSRQQWLTSTVTGRELWGRLMVQQNLDLDSINNVIKEAYVKDVGSARIGRPPISEYRAKLLEEAFLEYVKPRNDKLVA